MGIMETIACKECGQVIYQEPRWIDTKTGMLHSCSTVQLESPPPNPTGTVLGREALAILRETVDSARATPETLREAVRDLLATVEAGEALVRDKHAAIEHLSSCLASANADVDKYQLEALDLQAMLKRGLALYDEVEAERDAALARVERVEARLRERGRVVDATGLEPRSAREGVAGSNPAAPVCYHEAEIASAQIHIEALEADLTTTRETLAEAQSVGDANWTEREAFRKALARVEGERDEAHDALAVAEREHRQFVAYHEQSADAWEDKYRALEADLNTARDAGQAVVAKVAVAFLREALTLARNAGLLDDEVTHA